MEHFVKKRSQHMRENNNGLLPLPKIFKQNQVSTSNQQEYRKNYLTEILKQQEETNTTINSTVTEINRNLQQGLTVQEKNYMQLVEKLSIQECTFDHVKNKLTDHDDYHNRLNDKIIAFDDFHQQLEEKINEQNTNHMRLNDRLMIQVAKSDELLECLLSTETSTMQIEQRLDKMEVLVEEEKQLSQATIDQLAFQEDLTRGIHTKLEKYEELYEDIQSRISKQEHIFHDINDKLQIQDMFHQSIMERLDSQDAVSQKMAVQLDTLRQTLVEKLEAAILSIDSKYKQTLHYLAGMVGLKERIIQKPSPQESANKEQEMVEINQE